MSYQRTPSIINRQHTVELPELLRDSLTGSWEAFVESAGTAGYTIPVDRDFTTALLRAWAGSEFVTGNCIDHPGLLFDLLDSGDLLADYSSTQYLDALSRRLAGVDDVDDIGRILREYRRREMVRIAIRDLAGWAPLEEVLMDLSLLADASIITALDALTPHVIRTSGLKSLRQGPGLVVLGMGKLGAHELNFSSDVDLVFAYPDDEAGWKRSRTSPHEFYLSLGQQLVQALDEQNEYGFVYRVDMRLRPYGDSGPLVASFDAMADYYQLQGREWERYAMIKARPVAGPDRQARLLMQMLKPFVFRRYLDFSAFDSLRQLKQQIEREVERKGMQDNIKLGPGGIREIEFIAQAFQLVRGGREAALQQRGVPGTLQALAELGLVPAADALQLTESWAFLRRVENRLQAFDDRQTHDLPDDDAGRARLAFTMGYPDWQGFAQALAGHRARVQGHFEQIFAAPDRGGEPFPDAAPGLAGAWSGTDEPETGIEALQAAGFAEPAEVLRWLRLFREGPAGRFLGEQGRRRLDELMPRILEQLAGSAQPLELLRRVGALLEAIAGRTTYLTLLVENPLALAQLVQLCDASPWVATQLSHYPILLDELLDPRTLYNPQDRGGLEGQLQLQLDGIAGDDLEQLMDRLRQFRQAAALHVAAADIVTGIPVTRVGDYLTWIAEVVLSRVVNIAREYMVARHGEPGYLRHGRLRKAGIAVVAYGKLGGNELGYGSDLDIVFLHDSAGNEQHTAGPAVIDNAEFFTRLSQRIIHILNTFTPAGILYEVDMRLRPNGNSGLLVSSLDAYAEYQRRSAWTWENQALIRARIVVGSREITRQFERIRSGVLARPRDADSLRQEVVDMRNRMRRELDRAGAGEIDLKHGPGGIVDIEFMVQFEVLRRAGQHDGLLRRTDTLGLLEALGAAGLLPKADVKVLSGAYCALRQAINHRVLQDESATVDDAVLADERSAVAEIWQRVMEQGVN